MSDLDQLHRDMTAWRHKIHSHPEFGFEEHRTARFVADTLRAIGVDEVIEGVGGTGVVATLTRGSGNRAIALRADMDALRITEVGDRPYRSTSPGVMHACGHDGHTTMLLGAARLLTEQGGFDGTVHFIFQPAEEWGHGALAMLKDGLLERFPFEEIYGLHNMPGYSAGTFVTRPGAIMSAEDNFEIVLHGVGGHASRPQVGRETMLPACELVVALQAIVSRRIDPGATAVVSVTEFLTNGTRNVLPGTATIRGDVRSFDANVSAEVESHMRRILKGIAVAHGLTADMTYTREFVPLINDPDCTAEAFAAAKAIMSEDRISVADAPVTVSEDFARFLEYVPGCFAFLGNGTSSLPLHNPEYDFADTILLDGARYFTEIARRRL